MLETASFLKAKTLLPGPEIIMADDPFGLIQTDLY